MKRIKRIISLTPSYLFVVAFCLIILLPIIIFIIASFKTSAEFATTPIFQFSTSPTFENYITVLEKGNFLVSFKNTFIILIVSAVINVAVNSMLAYAMTFFKFRFKPVILGMVMGARVIPTITTQVAVFSIIKGLGLYNTIGAPIILYAGASAVEVVLFLQFAKNIPYLLVESAHLDGASNLKIYTRIVLPLMKPACITSVILKVVNVYNDMYIPYLYMPSSKLNVISTAVMKFSGSNVGAQIPVLAATFIITVLPMFVFYIFSQKFLFAGLTAGSVKE